MLEFKANAPEKGIVYALLRNQVVFKGYESLEEVEQLAADGKLLELHLFDGEKEFRRVRTRMDGFLDTVITDETEKEKAGDAFDTYEESVFVLGADVDQSADFKNKVIVVNYITYNEDDMITISNYRLKEAE